MRISLIFLLLFLHFSGKSQDSIGFVEWNEFPTKTNNQTEPTVYCQFFLTNKTSFKDSVHITFISEIDTLCITTNTIGSDTLKIPEGNYQIIVTTFFTKPLVSSPISFSNKNDYTFKFYLESQVFTIPQMRYDLGKPVIYAYSTVPIPTVTLSYSSTAYQTFNYPYDLPWSFDVDSTGIHYKNQLIPYLFWDGKYNYNPVNFNYDYNIVSRKNLAIYLENALKKMGFTDNEATAFITYWVPQMMAAYYKVGFIFNEDCNVFAKYCCTPQPDSFYRMYMIWEPVNAESEKLNDLDFPKINREGFHLIEWGGFGLSDKTSEPSQP